MDPLIIPVIIVLVISIVAVGGRFLLGALLIRRDRREYVRVFGADAHR